MKKKVVLYKQIPSAELMRLKMHFEVCFFDGLNDDNYDEFISSLSDAHGLIGASKPINESILKYAPKLKACSTISVGLDQFDVDYLNQRGIALMHTPSVLTETTADTIFTLLMCSARRGVELSNMVREGQWQRSIGSEHYGVNIYGKTIGIIGMGRIGYALAKRAHLGFDMPVHYFNLSPNQQANSDLDAIQMSLEEVLKTADFVCVVLPLTKQTEKLIGAEQLAMMKPSAIFINGSRGKIVDEAALIEALQQKTILAAGLDVFEVEPLPASSQLCRLDNVTLFPHIGSATHETRNAMVTCAVDNLIAALNNDLSLNCANQHQLR
ncbi:NAD(P)-dependent oxidoreductase [Vibrio scophthalmi]|uniref:Phosphogluconate 2-dehydrogenase n=1 Tax=Vibrio scophthalmi TaxID=45658 RepID=A0A1C7FGG2_9VIBR|nr:NAD(P)-dependent oxidoreductase [Vibrio scophthalmi]ANU38986.1 Phosphogluconate 2-dehydrogenase [Vibrio scophthalmi]